MIITNISDFRKYIKFYFDKVAKKIENLITNGEKDSEIVVSHDEYNSLIATNHELSNKTNENRLDSAIEKLKKGNSF